MPIYEYKCKKCGHKFDAFQRVGDDGTHLKCPVCGEPSPEKLFSAFASSGSETTSSYSSSSCGSSPFS